VVDKYKDLFDFIGEAVGKELEIRLAAWNLKYPDMAVKLSTLYQKKKAYEEYGTTALIPRYGKSSGRSRVKKEWMDKYSDLYLNQGRPSVYSCWLKVLGFARLSNPDLSVEDFPCPQSFDRQLRKRYSASMIYMKRYGEEKWNRKHGDYIERDYSNVKPGECYVSDHAQIDVAVNLPSGKTCFPWLTAWIDFTSQKFLGWLLHPEPPNSDHIFQSFYYTCRDHGIPTDVYLDNGKDYRCKDFAGGREWRKVKVDEGKMKPAIREMGITAHFAIPYNAQTKNIERNFLKIKEWFSKHMIGYRGGHVEERPEKLAGEIKDGTPLCWNEYTKLFDDFIINVLNKMPSSGKALKGMSPDELWAKERIDPRKASPESLKLFCMRTSREKSIGKNGVKDTELDCHYWADWMAGCRGEKVYLRRDINSYQEAYVFKAKDDEFLGIAYIAERVPALVRTDVERKQLKEAMARKKRAKKLEKACFEAKNEIPYEDKIVYMKAGVNAINEARGYKEIENEEKDNIVSLIVTSMDKVARQAKKQRKEEEKDFSILFPKEEKKKKADDVKTFWSDVLSDEEWERMFGRAIGE